MDKLFSNVDLKKLKGDINAQARTVINNVFLVLNELKCDPEKISRLNFNKPREITALLCGVSISTVDRIKKEVTLSGHPSAPRESYTKPATVTGTDNFDITIFERVIASCYDNGEYPTAARILEKYQKQMPGFKCGESSMKKILKKIGFTLKRNMEGRKLVNSSGVGSEVGMLKPLGEQQGSKEGLDGQRSQKHLLGVRPPLPAEGVGAGTEVARDDHDVKVEAEVKLEPADVEPGPLQRCAASEKDRGYTMTVNQSILQEEIDIDDIKRELDSDSDTGEMETTPHPGYLVHPASVATHAVDDKAPASGQAQHCSATAALPPRRQLIEIDLGTVSVVGTHKRATVSRETQKVQLNVPQKRPNVPQEEPNVPQERNVPQDRINIPQKRPSILQRRPATKKMAVDDEQNAGQFGFQVFTHSSASKAGSSCDAAAEPGASTSATFVLGGGGSGK